MHFLTDYCSELTVTKIPNHCITTGRDAMIRDFQYVQMPHVKWHSHKNVNVSAVIKSA